MAQLIANYDVNVFMRLQKMLAGRLKRGRHQPVQTRLLRSLPPRPRLPLSIHQHQRSFRQDRPAH
jgi:hypothetical protein